MVMKLAKAADEKPPIAKAVVRKGAGVAGKVLDHAFAFAFRGLVYAQIWEDPDVDREALQLGANHRVIAIASGGCNVLSYLVDDPKEIIAVDLNGAHIALNRLKLAGLQVLDSHELFFQFFGRADMRANIALYDQKLRPALDES